MPLFKYFATDMKGCKHKGVLDGDSSQNVCQRLREMKLIPIEVLEIQKSKAKNPGISRWLKTKVSQRELSVLTYQLSTLLTAGLSIEAALLSIAEQMENSALNTILLNVRIFVLEGQTLAYSMGEFPAVFPILYRMTVAAGEQSGRLDYVINKLAEYLEQQENIRQRITQALIYPSLLTFVSLLIIGFLLSYTMPKITAIFQETGQPLPDLTLFLLSVSTHLKSEGLYYFIAFIILTLGFRKLLRFPSFRLQVHIFVLKIPLIKSMVIAVNAARFSRTFGILYSATVPVLEAMRTANNTVSLIPMHLALTGAIIQVGEGISIHQALLQTGYFSKLMTQLIASGEASGKLDLMLEKAANYHEKTTLRRIDIALSLFEPATILLMGMIILFIVLATLLPIFEMNEFVN